MKTKFEDRAIERGNKLNIVGLCEDYIIICIDSPKKGTIYFRLALSDVMPLIHGLASEFLKYSKSKMGEQNGKSYS